MGCGSSTPQPEGDSSSSKKLRLSCFIPHRTRKRVGDPIIMLDHHYNDKMMNCKAGEEGNRVVVVDPVWRRRGIDEEEEEEEDEYAVSSKPKDVKKIDQYPSFSIYCNRVDSFDDTNSSSSTNYDSDDVKTMHGRHKSTHTAGSSVMSIDEEEEESSKSNKPEVQKGREMTKKTAWNWKLASPLGMKKNLLFVMSSCYSSSPHNRHTLLSRG